MPSAGEIRLFASDYAPAGWALCDGGSLSIAENDQLFQMIGTTYGGDGETYFNLPNLSGRVPIHSATDFPLGQQGSAPFGLTNPTTLSYVIALTESPDEDPWVGEVRTFAFGLTPRNWAICDGQMLPIQGNEVLYSLLGDTYGGDINNYFRLPNLEGTGAVAPPSAADATQPAGISWLVMNFCIALEGFFPSKS